MGCFESSYVSSVGAAAALDSVKDIPAGEPNFIKSGPVRVSDWQLYPERLEGREWPPSRDLISSHWPGTSCGPISHKESITLLSGSREDGVSLLLHTLQLYEAPRWGLYVRGPHAIHLPNTGEVMWVARGWIS